MIPKIELEEVLDTELKTGDWVWFDDEFQQVGKIKTETGRAVLLGVNSCLCEGQSPWTLKIEGITIYRVKVTE